MYASTTFVFALAGLAAAQSAATTSSAPTSGSLSGCGSQIDTIIKSCLGSTQPQLDACEANDWDCMCEQANNVLTCYNNCPSAPQKFGMEQTKVSYCNASKAYGSSASASMAATASASGSGSASAPTAAVQSGSTMPTQTGSSSSSGSGTSSGPSSTRSSSSESAAPTSSGSAASHVGVPAGLAAIFGLVAFL